VKLLIDNCFSRRFAARLAEAGHDVFWAGEWGIDPGDEEILRRARESRSVLVTRDQDFATLAIKHGHRHTGILRIVDTTTEQSVRVCLEAIASRGDELGAGAIVVAFLHQTRVHRP
jgi:predicted nuclease of predicted toxin-antitoxin system